ncbi:MAG TPA: hypothetical protein VNN80_02285 [Polyangiaceae bacterium]|nr:hypothetical protein [Polyangiaceae bacterium]
MQGKQSVGSAMPQPGEGSGSPLGTLLVPPEPPSVPVAVSVVPVPLSPPTPELLELVVVPPAGPAEVVLALVALEETLPTADVLGPPMPPAVVFPFPFPFPFPWPLVAVVPLVGPPVVLVAPPVVLVTPPASVVSSLLVAGSLSDAQAIAKNGATPITRIPNTKLPVDRLDVMLAS